jgi:hypothetical protein
MDSQDGDGWKFGLPGWMRMDMYGLPGLPGCMDGWKCGGMDPWMDEWMHLWMEGKMHGSMEAWMDGWMDPWMEWCVRGARGLFV